MPVVETRGNLTASAYGLNSFYTELVGYYDAGLAASAPTGANGTTWKNLASGPRKMGDIAVQYTNTNWSYGGSGTGGYVQNTTQSDVGGMRVFIGDGVSNWRKIAGTMEFWLYPTQYVSGGGLFVNREDQTPNDPDWWWFGSWDAGNAYYHRMGNNCCDNDHSSGNYTYKLNAETWAASVPVNTWKHVTVTWDKRGALASQYSRIYLNGVLWSERVGMSLDQPNPGNPGGATYGRFGLGHGTGGSANWLGRIGLIRCYREPLTAAGVVSNFNRERSRYGV